MATPPDFVSGQILTAAQMNAVGMWKITSSALTGSSVSISNCFSADYNYYRIIARAPVTGSADIRFNLRASGSDITATNYFYGSYETRSNNTSAIGVAANSQARAVLYQAGSGTAMSSFVIDVLNPFQALFTSANGSYSRLDQGGAFYAFGTTGFNYAANTSADGFTLSLSANNFAADAEVFVYGYTP